MLSAVPPRSRRKVGGLVVLALLTFGVAFWTAGASATHAPPGTILWGYQAAIGSPALGAWDIGTDTFVSSCVPDTGSSTNGRGLAQDPFDGGLWYSRLDGFTGDGLIHKTGAPLPAPRWARSRSGTARGARSKMTSERSMSTRSTATSGSRATRASAASS